MKLETFSFTRYGTVPATLLRVTSDAVVDEKRRAVFSAMLTFARHVIDIDGQAVQVSPGLNVTAEIKIGRRRVIEYLLSPIQKSASQSLKER